MTLRAGHGTGAGVPRIEVLPADELPAPLPAPVAAPVAPLAFRGDGTIADGTTAKELGRRGGLAKARKLRLVDTLGLKKIADESDFAPYRNAAEDFVTAHLAALAQVAGGEVGPGPSSIVASSALQLAGSRWAFDKFAETLEPGLAKLGSSLADAHRQNLLAAYELARREGEARPKRKADPLDSYMPPKESGK